MTTTFRSLLGGRPDPNADDPGALGRAFNTTLVANSPPTCFQLCDNPMDPLFFLGSNATTHNPIVFCAPYTTDTPGRADNNNLKYSLCGDIDDNGVLPSVVDWDQSVFEETDEVPVPTTATMLAAWAGLAPGQSRLPVPAADTEEISTRRMMVIPYPYVAPILQAHQNGDLTWRWLVVHVVTPILVTPQQAQDYDFFVDYVRVASTAPPLGAAGAVVYPETELEFTAILDVPRAQRTLLPMMRRYLPDLGQAQGFNSTC
jgi:hypothetical protein